MTLFTVLQNKQFIYLKGITK